MRRGETNIWALSDGNPCRGEPTVRPLCGRVRGGCAPQGGPLRRLIDDPEKADTLTYTFCGFFLTGSFATIK
jgi:hypothetical protein